MEDKEEINVTNGDNVAREPTIGELFSYIQANMATKQDVEGIAARVSVLERSASEAATSIPFLGARGLGLGQQAQDQTPARNAVEESFYRDPLFLGTTVDRQTADPRRTQSAARQSILERNIQNSEDSAIQLQMQARQPPYDHIKLTSVHSLAQVIKFIDEAEKYQTQHRIKLPLPSLVSDTARDDIMTEDHKLTIAKFYNLSDLELFDLLQKKVKPGSPLEFSRKLDSHVDFVISKGYKPTPSDFKFFLQALRTYRQKFRKLFELLAKDNGENVPEMKNKDEGVIKIFLKKIPFEYGNRVWQTMRTPRCATLYEFLKKWDEVVNLHEEQHKGAVQLKQHFGGSDWFARNQGDKINAVAEESFPGDTRSGDPPAAQKEADSVDAAFPAPSDGEDIDGHDVDHWISVLSGTQPKPKEPYVCLSKLINGECKKPNCSYDHNEARLNEQRRRHVELCNEQLRKSTNKKPSVSLLQRPANEEPDDDSA
jgi:hypothetical protein